MNIENLKYTRVHKFSTEENNVAIIIKWMKEYNESWKSEI
jgi:hypothetical protein